MEINITKDQVRFMGMVHDLVKRSKEGDASFVPVSKATKEDLENRIVYVDDECTYGYSHNEFNIVKDAEVADNGSILVKSVFSDPSGNVDVMAEHTTSEGWCVDVFVSDPDDPDADYSEFPPADPELLERELIVIKNGDWECSIY